MNSSPPAGARIPLLDLQRPLTETPGLRHTLLAAFARVLDSGTYILGPEVEAFERDIATYCQMPHGIGVSSGTDALLLALMALQIGPGDDVLCPTYTFFASAGSISRVGARPVFVDCCPGCFNILPEAAWARRTANTRAIMPVHLFGQVASMGPLCAWATAQHLEIIEDAAQALGARGPHGLAGTMGSLGCFSFFPSKNLGALGDAGLIVTACDDLGERLRVLRVHGGKPKYVHTAVGGNFRLDALQAALLRAKLPHLDAATQARARHAALYKQLFAASDWATTVPCRCTPAGTCAGDTNDAAPLVLPTASVGRHIYNQYIVRIRYGRRDAVRAALAAENIGTEIYYPVPMHLQPCFAHLGYRRGDFPHAEAAAQQTLALPIFPELQTHEIERIAQRVLELCRP